jgi:hypothetical protein
MEAEPWRLAHSVLQVCSNDSSVTRALSVLRVLILEGKGLQMLSELLVSALERMGLLFLF